MPIPLRHALAATAAVLALAAPAAAQQPAGLMGDLLKDVGDLESKMVALAKEMPAQTMQWRPGTGVRSVGEVFLHVAADNYLMPSAVGVQPDASTGIKATDFSTLATFEKQKMPRDSMVATIQKSFTHLKKAMADTPEARLGETVTFFGQSMTVRQVWVLTTTHLHEHLGQAIAYARTNRVVPPWSRKGS